MEEPVDKTTLDRAADTDTVTIPLREYEELKRRAKTLTREVLRLQRIIHRTRRRT